MYIVALNHRSSLEKRKWPVKQRYKAHGWGGSYDVDPMWSLQPCWLPHSLSAPVPMHPASSRDFLFLVFHNSRSCLTAKHRPWHDPSSQELARSIIGRRTQWSDTFGDPRSKKSGKWLQGSSEPSEICSFLRTKPISSWFVFVMVELCTL